MAKEDGHFERSIEPQHGRKATFAQSVPVKETNGEGVVHVFDLADHPTATRVYAWSSPSGAATSAGSLPCSIWGAIKSPGGAVRAAIVAEHRA
jgi:hypothetical protein